MITFNLITVFIIWDNEDSWLFYTKMLFYFNAAMSIWSHVMASITNPGAITHDNNVHVLELYINTHSHCVKNADNFNIRFRDILKKQEDGKESDSDLDNSDWGHQYDIHSPIRNAAIEEISKQYRIKLTRCTKCLVVRPPRAHHCTRCKQCFLKKDHHCPWINNCLGFFNQKHFMLFSYYSMNGVFLSIYMMLYYVMYKQYKVYKQSTGLITLSIFHLVFGIIFLIFSICMLKDQWNTIRNETTVIDFKEKKFLEARDIDECWDEAFGEEFHIWWFFPINRSKWRERYVKGREPEDPEAEKKEEEENAKKEAEEKKVGKKEDKKTDKDKGGKKAGFPADMPMDQMSMIEMLKEMKRNSEERPLIAKEPIESRPSSKEIEQEKRIKELERQMEEFKKFKSEQKPNSTGEPDWLKEKDM